MDHFNLSDVGPTTKKRFEIPLHQQGTLCFTASLCAGRPVRLTSVRLANGGIAEKSQLYAAPEDGFFLFRLDTSVGDFDAIVQVIHYSAMSWHGMAYPFYLLLFTLTLTSTLILFLP